MHTPNLLGWVKNVKTLNCADKYKYNLIELNDLIDFGYDDSDTQDGFKCWRMGYTSCCKHSFLLTWIQVSDPGPMGPVVSHSNHILWVLKRIVSV